MARGSSGRLGPASNGSPDGRAASVARA